MVLRLDKLNPLKSTLITQPKSVEVIAAYEFHQNGLGPRLLSVFKNGRVEEWIEVSLPFVRSPSIENFVLRLNLLWSD